MPPELHTDDGILDQSGPGPGPAGDPPGTHLAGDSSAGRVPAQAPGRGRWVRRSVALALVLAGLGYLAGGVLVPVTDEAVVSARLVQVRAPIDGFVDDPRKDAGDAVAGGEELARLTNPHLDAAHAAGLRVRRAELAARCDRLAWEQGLTERAEAAARAVAVEYRRGALGSLAGVWGEAEARVRVAEAEAGVARTRVEFEERMSAGGVSSTFTRAEAREASAAAVARVEVSRATLRRAGAEAEAGGRGVFPGRDVLPAEQWADQLGLRAALLRAESEEARGQLAAVEAELYREESRVRGLAEAGVQSPVTGVIWKRHAGPGSAVKRGEVLYEAAEARSTYVEALIHQRHAGAVTPGCRASVRVAGAPPVTGRVRSVTSPGPAGDDPTAVVRLPVRDQAVMRVRIETDEPLPVTLLGRQARVVVEGSDDGVFARVVARLFGLGR